MKVNKLWILLATLVVGLALVVGITAVASKAHINTAVNTENSNPVAQAGSNGALSAERLQHYDNLLQKSVREQPYLIAPREDTVLREVTLALGKDATPEQIQAAVDQYYKDFYEHNNKVSRPNPLARLGREKQLEIA
ncbi:MAG: hypothetical protein P8Z00_23435, partial [Anaerolineales bacterium]